MTHHQIIKNCTGGKPDPNFPTLVQSGSLRSEMAYEITSGEIPTGETLYAVGVFCWTDHEDMRARKLRRIFRSLDLATQYVSRLKSAFRPHYTSLGFILKRAEDGFNF